MHTRRVLALFLFVVLLGAAILLVPPSWLPQSLQPYYYSWFGEPSYQEPPASRKITIAQAEPFCPDEHPDWRKRQVIDGVTVEESLLCEPDNPRAMAAFVKSTNNVSMDTLMRAGLTPDAVPPSPVCARRVPPSGDTESGLAARGCLSQSCHQSQTLQELLMVDDLSVERKHVLKVDRPGVY